MGTVRELRDFLIEAELDHYYNAFKNELKIATIPQLKYVEEEDLSAIGMTKPEMRRLKKYYKKECPQGKLQKIKQAFLNKTNLDSSIRSLSPSPPENRVSRPVSYIRSSGKQIISADAITVNKTLGEGEFGVVQQGIWRTEDGEKVQVAIKCLSKEKMHAGTQEFLKEAGLMQTIDHENIVRMYGVVLDKDNNSLMLVTELAPMRSLLECLKETSIRYDFPLPRLCDFAQQICDGMSYLESKRLIHRDLAARNILVFSKNKVKISDFGLSRALGAGKDYYQSNFSVNLKLPIAWCAPECINYLKFTSASDVWAFGVTMWEMFTYGFQPWAGLTGEQILDAIDTPNCQRLEQPELCPKQYYDLMQSCWDHEPENRPTFSEMFIRLPQMRPVQVKAIKDFPEITVPKGFLYYRAYDVIVVIEKSPSQPPAPGFWKGVLNSGKCGYFDPTNAVPFIEPKTSPVNPAPKTSITRKESKRSSRKLRVDMISRPQNDLRHTGHIGYDGAVFGDVSFIGDNYDKLPLKVSSTGKLDDIKTNSLHISHVSGSPDMDRNMRNSLSDGSINGAIGTNGFSRSWISQESLESTSTMRTESELDGHHTPQYQDIDDDSLLADFKMPDMSSSFDFGPSFMDEVLKALNEKESKLDNSPEKSSNSSSRDEGFQQSFDRSRSVSPPKEVKSPPPPLPSQPPRSDVKKDSRLEPRKQAKVKPMSASDEKMIDDAIAMANEFASHTSRSNNVAKTQGSPISPISDRTYSDSDSGSESPRLMSKLKLSIKRSSPKTERKRTFSEEIATRGEIDDTVPPEAQAAYNMLVVHGSIKEGSRNRQRPSETSISDRDSRNSKGSSGSIKFIDKSSPSSSASRTPDRTSPPKSVSRSSSERMSVSPPKTFGRIVSDFERTQERKVDSKPVPKPRPEVAKRSEIPVPKPRPEILRVEPIPRPPPPPIPTEYKAEDKAAILKSFEKSKSEDVTDSAFDNPLVINEDDVYPKADSSINTINSVGSDRIEIVRVDMPNKEQPKEQIKRREKSPEPVKNPTPESSPKFGHFEAEFSEPSPREIMSKLARESRLRRSIDHQRGVLGEGDSAPNRNLREPQGIPGKSFSTSSVGDEEEVDTNPLRMLRGGAIPIRGGRGGAARRMVRK